MLSKQIKSPPILLIDRDLIVVSVLKIALIFLLGEKEFLFGEDFQGVVEAQTLRFGPVVIAVAEHFVASGDQGFVASSGHVVCFLVG